MKSIPNQPLISYLYLRIFSFTFLKCALERSHKCFRVFKSFLCNLSCENCISTQSVFLKYQKLHSLATRSNAFSFQSSIHNTIYLHISLKPLIIARTGTMHCKKKVFPFHYAIVFQHCSEMQISEHIILYELSESLLPLEVSV